MLDESEYAWVPEPTPEPRRPVLVLLQSLAVLLAGVLGFPLGLLWQSIAPNVPVLIVQDGAIYNDSQPEQFMSGDGWFAVLGFSFGVVLAVITWALFRRLRGPLLLVLLAVAGTVAAVIAWKFGRELGLDAYVKELHSAPVGTELGKPNDLRIQAARWWPPKLEGVLLLPALGSTLTVTLLAAWSRWPSLRAPRSAGTPEAAPVVGPDEAGGPAFS
ncbi:MAG: DUF2567 domain-containing protein [Hamadaea sp.]|uniref:DUF2567 domain-containing protein n=1 Tax=Hamadaea sp. TaxID=2024425 RepID=UPI001840662E|nr:DUF2567 domain-containing protein [Hamadaea sp.]NUR69937.1 DUF2567 domain-containing protein [Hamadaea sp.]NUT21641.1 DUF2567 domain-containing protein [Hamadaea sp.]